MKEKEMVDSLTNQTINDLTNITSFKNQIKKMSNEELLRYYISFTIANSIFSPPETSYKDLAKFLKKEIIKRGRKFDLQGDVK